MLGSDAGFMLRKPLRDLALPEWSAVIGTNMTATYLLARAAEAMLRVAPGSIVAIASTRAHMSDPDTESYSASKGGLVALTHALAVSLGPEVMANVVSPGWIDVRGEALRPIHHAPHPAGRVGRVEDVTAMVAWLPVAGERLRDRGGVRGGWRITASTSPTSSGSSAAKARRVADHIKRVGAMAASSSQRQSNRRAPGRTSPAR